MHTKVLYGKSSFINSTMYYIHKLSFYLIRKVLNITLNGLCITLLLTFTLLVFLTIRKCNFTIDKITVSKQNPIIVWWTTGFPGTSETRYCSDNLKCDVFSNKSISELTNVQAYLFYGSNTKFEDLPLPREPENIIWGLYHEESPRNVEEFMHEKILNLFNFSSTMSRYSNVPFPLQYLGSLQDITSTKYFVQTSDKNKFLSEISPIMYLQSDCETATERDSYVKELMKLIEIDSYGLCLNNKNMPSKFKNDYLNNLNDNDFLEFVARYKFVIAIENGICEDYITEKLWRAIKVGTVPIYFGSPTVMDWLPNSKSAILLEDYPTPELLHRHIEELMSNDGLYEEYLEHKVKQIIRNEKLTEELRIRPYQTDSLKSAEKFECLICEKLHEIKNGKLTKNIVNKFHYNCPEPISALTLQVNPSNNWVYSWKTAETRAENIYKNIMLIEV